MQTALLRVWIRVAIFIPFNNNYNAMSLFYLFRDTQNMNPILSQVWYIDAKILGSVFDLVYLLNTISNPYSNPVSWGCRIFWPSCESNKYTLLAMKPSAAAHFAHM